MNTPHKHSKEIKAWAEFSNSIVGKAEWTRMEFDE